MSPKQNSPAGKPTPGSREVVPGFVEFEVGSSPERLTWDAPRTAKSEEEDPGCKTPTGPPRAPRRRLPIVTGCGWGNYCPLQPVTREQMGVFIVVTFGLTLYGV